MKGEGKLLADLCKYLFYILSQGFHYECCNFGDFSHINSCWGM